MPYAIMYANCANSFCWLSEKHQVKSPILWIFHCCVDYCTKVFLTRTLLLKSWGQCLGQCPPNFLNPSASQDCTLFDTGT